ncbi:MAG: DNA-3-methyladenine glycosylase [Candidatus Dormibacteria bacterium]
MASFTIEPDGPFSLEAAAGFGFGPNTGRPKPAGGEMRLAFVTDDLRHHAGVHLTQDPNGTVRGTAETEAEIGAVRTQVARILSLDRPGPDWVAVGARDPVIGQLQRDHPGLRPVLFHSPYEAAAWSILSARRHHAQAAAVRTRLAATFGRTFTISGDRVEAFPLPERLRSVENFASIEARRMERLHGVAEAALRGDLEPGKLLTMEPNQALEHIKQLPGIGDTYATLILLRATGATDLLTLNEPRLPSYAAHFYNLGHPAASSAELEAISEHWRPFRTWAAVLVRVAGDRLGLPVQAAVTSRPRPRSLDRSRTGGQAGGKE